MARGAGIEVLAEVFEVPVSVVVSVLSIDAVEGSVG